MRSSSNFAVPPPSPIQITNRTNSNGQRKFELEENFERDDEGSSSGSPLSARVQAVALSSSRRRASSRCSEHDNESDQHYQEDSVENEELNESGEEEWADQEQLEEEHHQSRSRRDESEEEAERGFGEGETKIKWRVADVEYLREEKRPKFQKENQCSACEMMFTFSKRRHHCRNCGKSFCQKHANCYTTIPRFGFDEPVRVCKGCYGSMIKTKMQDTRTAKAEESRPVSKSPPSSPKSPRSILRATAYPSPGEK